MNINPYEFEKAKDGDLFVKKGNELVAVNIDELLKPYKDDMSKCGELEFKYKVLSKSLKRLETSAKTRFIVVYNLFLTKAMLGNYELNNELVNLDENVLRGELSVEEALEKHEFLKKMYNVLYK